MHHNLNENDSFQFPPDCIARVYKKQKFMGWYNATYIFAQQQARLRLKEAMLTFVWLETLVQDGNKVYIRPNKLAETLKVSKPTIYNHLAKIREEGLMIPDADEVDEAVVRVYRICPFHAWRGKADQMAQYLDTLPREHPFFSYTDPEFQKRIEFEFLDEQE